MKQESPVISLSGVPLYQQVKQAVLDLLAQGEWKQGEAIPPERELAERFQVSIGTLRKAIDELAADTILTRHQGRGTFVAIHNQSQHFFKFFKVVKKDGSKTYPIAEFKRFKKRRATQLEKEKLQLGPNAEVYEFIVLQNLNDDKVMIDTISVSTKLFAKLSLEKLANKKSTLYNLYQHEFGINVIDVDERLSVNTINAIQSKWLGVAEGRSLLQIHRVAYSYNNQPVEWRVSLLNTDKYEYASKEVNI